MPKSRRLISASSLQPGDKVDEYTVEDLLGEGGSAEVYTVRDMRSSFPRLFAMKILKEEHVGNPIMLHGFLKEAYLGARVHHVNVCSAIFVGSKPRQESSKAGSRPYIVMDLIHGETFGRLLFHAQKSKYPVPAAIVIRVVVDALCGLRAVHELTDDKGIRVGVIHRDVSLENVMVGYDGTAKLLDMGVAKTSHSHTIVGTWKGKPKCMAPEQFRAGAYDHRVDIYAMGVVLWEGLWRRRAPHMTLEQRFQVPEPKYPAPVGIHHAVLQVLAKALESDPAVRYQTALEFAQALERAARQANVLATATDVAEYMCEMHERLQQEAPTIVWSDEEQAGALAASSKPDDMADSSEEIAISSAIEPLDEGDSSAEKRATSTPSEMDPPDDVELPSQDVAISTGGKLLDGGESTGKEGANPANGKSLGEVESSKMGTTTVKRGLLSDAVIGKWKRLTMILVPALCVSIGALFGVSASSLLRGSNNGGEPFSHSEPPSFGPMSSDGSIDSPRLTSTDVTGGEAVAAEAASATPDGGRLDLPPRWRDGHRRAADSGINVGRTPRGRAPESERNKVGGLGEEIVNPWNQ